MSRRYPYTRGFASPGSTSAKSVNLYEARKDHLTRARKSKYWGDRYKEMQKRAADGDERAIEWLKLRMLRTASALSQHRFGAKKPTKIKLSFLEREIPDEK